MNQVGARFVVCVNNDGYAGSLDRRKLYQEIPDSEAAKRNLVRVIDESGEDYLFPSAMFVTVELTDETKDALLSA